MLRAKELLSLLVFLVLAFQGVRSLNPSLNDDVLGLIVFKADLQDPMRKLSSWNQDDDTPCKWFGVKCNPRSNRVAELTLDGLSLSGRIGRGLLQLQFLHKLSLSRNNLTGSINPNLTRLENLRIIDLSENSLSGTISEDFFKECAALRDLSLANNKFSGKIPGFLSSCASLASINLSSNQFTGSLPAEIWGLNGLRSLDLSGNGAVAGELASKDVEGEGSVQGNGPPQFNDQPNFRTLREYLHPARQSTPSCIILPLNQQAFNLKPGMIQLLPTFHGMDSENPYIHIKDFEEVYRYMERNAS